MAEIYLDFDGPLLDVRKRQYLVYKCIITSLKGIPLSEFKYWQYKRRKTSLKNILKKSSLDNKVCIFRKRWNELIESRLYLKTDRLFSGTEKMLKKLSNRHSLFLVSLRKSRKELLWQLKVLKIVQYFPKVLCGDFNKGGWKVKYALMKREGPAIDSYMIGDTEVDILSGNKLRMKTIALTCGIRNEEFLRKLKPRYLLRNLKEAVEIIEGSHG